MTTLIAQLAKTGLQKAKQLGAEHAEIFLVQNRSFKLELKDHQISEMKQAESQGIGIRIIKDHRQGFSFSADLRSSALERMVYQAITNSQYSDSEEHLFFPMPSSRYPGPKLWDSTMANHSVAEKRELVEQTTESALAADSRVERVERAGYGEGESHVLLANTNGILLQERKNYCNLYCSALGRQGQEQQSGYGMDLRMHYSQLSPQQAGQMAGTKAVQLLGAQCIDSGVMELVLEPMIAADILEIISVCFFGEQVQKKKSFLADRLGQQVAGAGVTLIDDGTMDHQLGSGAFDGEGTATQKTVLVEDGILKQYLYDCLSARKAGAKSTGNCARGSYKGMPHTGTNNYYVAAGSQTPDAIIGQVDSGIYVTEILGAHTANPVSGNFSFGASGILIRNGRLTTPVRGITIAGNLQQLLQNITGVGNDLTFFGGTGAPTLRIANIAVSGK